MILIASLMAICYVLLRSIVYRTVVMLALVPLDIAKNGLRVFTLTALAAYVDPGVLNSELHRKAAVILRDGLSAGVRRPLDDCPTGAWGIGPTSSGQGYSWIRNCEESQHGTA
jgi:exosortase/archaeosortase family protein